MTGPAILGYPDYRHTFAAARQLLYQDVANSISAPLVSPAIPIGNLSDIGIFLLATTNHVRVSFDWFLDQALTMQITTDNVEVRGTKVFDQTIRVKGSFLRITITPFGGPPSVYSLSVYEAAGPAMSQRNAAGNNIISQDGVSVAATTTTTLDAGFVAGGLGAFLAYSSDATTWAVILRSIGADGATRIYSRVNQAAASQGPQVIATPNTLMQVQFVNGDASARTFFAYLSIKPNYP